MPVAGKVEDVNQKRDADPGCPTDQEPDCKGLAPAVEHGTPQFHDDGLDAPGQKDGEPDSAHGPGSGQGKSNG